MKLRVSMDATASPFLLLGQLSIFRGRLRCLDQIMRLTQTAELNGKQTWKTVTLFTCFWSVIAQNWRKAIVSLGLSLWCPPPRLKGSPPTAEPWHCHHTLPLVSTGTGLAVLSNSNAQHSRICHPKGKHLYPISKPFNMQSLFCSFAAQAAADLASGVTVRSRKTISEPQSSRESPNSALDRWEEAEPERSEV